MNQFHYQWTSSFVNCTTLIDERLSLLLHRTIELVFLFLLVHNFIFQMKGIEPVPIEWISSSVNCKVLHLWSAFLNSYTEQLRSLFFLFWFIFSTFKLRIMDHFCSSELVPLWITQHFRSWAIFINVTQNNWIVFFKFIVWSSKLRGMNQFLSGDFAECK